MYNYILSHLLVAERKRRLDKTMEEQRGFGKCRCQNADNL